MGRRHDKKLAKAVTNDCNKRERIRIRYAVYKASNLTPTQAKLHLGFDNMTHRAVSVQECIDEVKAINEAYIQLAHAQELALF